MLSRHVLLLTAFSCTCLLSSFADVVDYTVQFEGLHDSRTLKSVKCASQLTTLHDHPPASINALRYRAESDVPQILKILHARGYYEAKVAIHLQEQSKRPKVIVQITPGERYHIEGFHIELYCETPEDGCDCCPIDLKDIGIEIGKPALAQTILDAELKTLNALSACGFPLAVVEDRNMVVDGNTKGLSVCLSIKTGPKSTFGPVTVSGIERVKPLYIDNKQAWSESQEYDSRLVEETQTTLMNSGLFSSVLITHESASPFDRQIPMKIELTETKHKSINIGVSYQTVFGPGITFGWENRNVAGMGRRLSFQGDITRISQTGLATYLHPDFLRLDQDFIWQAQAAHESLFAYSMRSYNTIQRIDRRFGKNFRAAFGMKGERLFVTESVHNGNYWLLEFPIYFRWSNANSLLDPTRGATVELTTTPTANFGSEKIGYVIQELSESTYLSLTSNASIVFAQQLTVGFLWSNGLNSVPVSKRFLGGFGK